MQLKIKREKHGHNQFRLSVRAEYTPQEKHQLRTHGDLGAMTILWEPHQKDLKDLNHKRSIFGIIWNLIMAGPGPELRITASSLEEGHILQGFMEDVLRAEQEITSKCEVLLARLDVGDLYDGEEEVVELGRNRATVARAEPPLEEA